MTTSSISKGTAVEHLVFSYLLDLGFKVYPASLPNDVTDAIVDINGELKRIQIKALRYKTKTARLKYIDLQSEYSVYKDCKIDYMVAADSFTGFVYMIPIDFTRTFKSCVSLDDIQQFKIVT